VASNRQAQETKLLLSQSQMPPFYAPKCPESPCLQELVVHDERAQETQKHVEKCRIQNDVVTPETPFHRQKRQEVYPTQKRIKARKWKQMHP
jgi:hypothetical protein